MMIGLGLGGLGLGASGGGGGGGVEGPAAPTLSGLPDLSVPTGTGVTVNCAGYATGSGLSWSMTGPAWLSINSGTGQITGTAPGSAETSTATVTVSNGGGSASDSFAVAVTASSALAMPPAVIPEAAATFMDATGWVLPAGVTIDTTSPGRAIIDGSGASRNIDRTIPALDTAKTYAICAGKKNFVGGRDQLALRDGGGAVTVMGSGYIAGHRAYRHQPAYPHVTLRYSALSQTVNPQFDVGDLQIYDITSLLTQPKAIIIHAGQSNRVGAFGTTGFDYEIDKPEPRALAVPCLANSAVGAVTDGSGTTYGLAAGTGIGVPMPMVSPLPHVTAVTVSSGPPAVMPQLSEARYLCDHWPYPGYTPTHLLGAFSGSSLFNTLHWNPTSSPQGSCLRLLKANIAALLASVPGSFVAGMVWQQGEADGPDPNYLTSFRTMINELRGLYGNFPLVVAEIGGLLTEPTISGCIAMQRKLASNSGDAAALARCAYVPRPAGSDYDLLEDQSGSWIHFRADTARAMGISVAQAMLGLINA